MEKTPKMTVCRNCNTTISANAKICPSCGAKNKKPFYQRGWFVVLAVIVVIGIIGAIGGGGGSKGEKFEWSDIELSNILPEPTSSVGKILSNSDEHLSIYIHKISKDEYNDYLDECQSIGFTVESDKSENNYNAYNEAGYELSLWYNDRDKELHIDLDAPMEMGTLQWPTSEIASLLPVPKSTVGTVSRESSDGFLIYVGGTSKDDYAAYVDECSARGFSIDYDRGDTFYYANNAEGYRISLRYQGNNVMSVEIEKAEEADSDATTASDSEAAPSTSAPEDNNPSEELVDGMRPEFKAAMDSYEAFYDEYCDFMKAYADNPTDLGLLADYADMMSKAADMSEKFDAWNEDEMNDAELKYYLEVSNRVAQKLLEVAQ